MVLMYFLCCVRKEIKMLIECLSDEEYRKIFHTESNHVSLCDVWVKAVLCGTLSVSPYGNPNLNRNPFLRENNKGFSFVFLVFIFVILWGQLDNLATPAPVRSFEPDGKLV
jgi:hypothetical protein